MNEPTPPGPDGQPPVVPDGQVPSGQPGAQSQPPGGAAPEALTIDGVAYTPDQVRALLKAKADYDQLQPEFTRRSQILTDPKRFREYGSKAYPDLFPSQPAQLSDEEKQRQEAIAEARKLGLLTKEEAETLAEEKMGSMLDQREADTFVKSEITRLEKEWDGTDGKPKFDPREILSFAAKEGLLPEDAFWKLKRNDLLEWHSTLKSKAKPKAPVIASPGGGGAAPVKPDDKLDVMKRGAVSGDFKNFLAEREQ